MIAAGRYTALKALALVSALGLTACAGDTSDLEAFVNQTKQTVKGSVAPLPQFEPYKNFVYDATDLRDPFLAKEEFEVQSDESDLVAQPNGLSPDRTRRREPLEAFPLDTLKMVGILEQDQNTWGLVRAPDGTIHRVLAGNHIGQNYGEITRIIEERISIYEIVPDGLGGWLEREASLILGDE